MGRLGVNFRKHEENLNPNVVISNFSVKLEQVLIH